MQTHHYWFQSSFFFEFYSGPHQDTIESGQKRVPACTFSPSLDLLQNRSRYYSRKSWLETLAISRRGARGGGGGWQKTAQKIFQKGILVKGM